MGRVPMLVVRKKEEWLLKSWPDENLMNTSHFQGESV